MMTQIADALGWGAIGTSLPLSLSHSSLTPLLSPPLPSSHSLIPFFSIGTDTSLNYDPTQALPSSLVSRCLKGRRRRGGREEERKRGGERRKRREEEEEGGGRREGNSEEERRNGDDEEGT